MKKVFYSALFLISGIAGYGQTIDGTFLDYNGAPIVNQLIILQEDSIQGGFINPNSFMDTATTDANGHYSFAIGNNIPAGDTIAIFAYNFTSGCSSASAFFQYDGNDTTINLNNCSNLNFPIDTIAVQVSLTNNQGIDSPANGATIYLIYKTLNNSTNAYNLTVVDSITDANGGFGWFPPLSTYGNTGGTYLLKAALPSTSPQYAGFLPTYYGDVLSWSQALPISVINWNHIHLIAGNNPGGPGFIGGSVLQGANRPTGVGDPMNSKLLLLTDINGNSVAYTYSDASGNFQFNHLALGDYKLFGDVLGKSNPTLEVSLTAADSVVDNIIFEENSTTFEGHFNTTGISDPGLNNLLKVFPNPVDNQLNIANLDAIKGSKEISIMTITGAVIYHQTINQSGLSIPMTGYASGMYILNIKTNLGFIRYKIVK